VRTRTHWKWNRLLRSPALITGEIAAIALAGILGASIPQGETATGLVYRLGLNHVFRSPWFLAITALTALSLSVVVYGQFKRLRAAWSRTLTPSDFESAPFRATFERPAAAPRAVLRLWSERRLGLVGSPLLHTGILLVILAGALRALFSAEAVVDLIEGETFQPAAAWSAQWPAVWAKPLRLTAPLTLKEVRSSQYKGGDLRSLEFKLAVGNPASVQERTVAVNRDTTVSGVRLFPASDFGPAPLLEWIGPDSRASRHAVLLKDRGAGRYEATLGGPDGLTAHLRAETRQDGSRPSLVEARVMKGNILVASEVLRPGNSVRLPGGQTLMLHGLPFWGRLRASRDPSLAFAYTGLVLILLGVTAVFTLVKRDACLVVTPLEGRERVFVALKPLRFAPLFEERFRRLIEEEAGGRTSHRSAEPRSSAVSCAAALPSGAAFSFVLLCSLLFASCNRVGNADARNLVQRYNDVVSEAYRRGDVKLIDPVVGPNEGKKIAGLIGVRLDMGITMDSRLTALEITGVEQSKETLRVRTRERWSYRDYRIGSGEPVSDESKDSYEMAYLFRKIDGAWLVDEIRFTSEPQVGRKKSLFEASPAVFHGMTSAGNAAAGGQP
jgi:hypothetical protein